ncbi:MAG: hypothetical protein Kow00121_62340 [Elainellaceae cyanobacterium]
MTEGNSGLFEGEQAQPVAVPTQLLQYSVALLSVAVALGVNLLLRPYLEPTPTPVFFAAVMISAWYGGLVPGLLATALSTLAINYFYIEPFHSLGLPSVGYVARLSVFVMAATLINSLNQAQRSAQRRAEANLQALRNSETRFSRLAESGIIGTLVADLNGSVVDANDAFLQMIGYSREDLCSGRVRWQEMTPSEYLDVSQRSLEELRTHGVCTPFEKEYIRKDGSRVAILLGSTMLGESTVIGFVVDITERKQAEEKLQRTNKTLQTLLDACPVAITFFDPQGIVRLWNRAAEQIFGWSAEEAIGHFMPTVSHRPQAFLASIQTVLSGRSLNGFEAQHQRKDGRMVDLEIWANLTHDAEGNPGCLGIAWDITERKQAETALRQSEERLRVALKNSPITVFNQDQELRYTWIYNPTIDCEPVAVIGKQDRDLFAGEDAAKLTKIKQQSLETGMAVREEVSLTIQGQRFHYDMTAEPLLASSGDVIGITCACIDITERKQMELALRQSETTLTALIASSPIGIAFFDQKLRYVHANEALTEINGITLSEHLGQTVWEVLPEWAPTVAPILQQVMATQAPLLNQELLVTTHRSNLVRHCLINYFPVCLPDGQVLGAGITAIDITERRHIEESLRESEERYRAVYDQVLIGISQADLTGKIISANERFCEIVGRSSEELRTLRMQDITHADDLPPNMVLFQQMLEDGTSFEIEKRYVRPGGALVWVRNYVSLIRDAKGQPQCGVAVTEDITEQKQAAAALYEQRHLLETILKHTTDAIMVCDASGRLTFVNPEARRLAQQDPQETMLDLNLLDWGTAYDADGNLIPVENYAISKALRGENCNTFESRMVRADGSYYDILVGAAPLLNNGQIIGAVANFIDISDRKQVEDERKRVQQELQQALQTLQTVIAASPLPIVVIEPDMTVQLWNTAAEQLFGWSQAELLGQPLPLVPAEKQEECRQLREAVTQGEVFSDVETYRCKRDGSRVALNISAAPLYNDQGRVDSILLILQDITEKQRAEANLRDSEERLRLALTAANQGLYDLNVQTGEAIVSPAYAQMLGYDPDEFQETNVQWRDRLHPDDVATVYKVYKDYVAGKLDTYRVEFRQRTKAGDWKWILSIGKIVSWDDNDQPLRMLGTHTDITDRKQAEAERERLLAREKTAREEAETANRIKDEFLAVLSHELRSPLNPILGWSKLLQTRKLDDQKIQQALATIERNAKLQAQLIEDLLDVSRILRGKFALSTASVDLVNTIEAALETVRLAVEAKGIEIQTVLPANVGPVIGDAARLQQVIWNLLTNAVKFTPPGGTVEIRLEQINTHAQIQVKDTGKGITPKFLPYVFDYFRQEDGTTTRKFGGLGLGLAIVRHITELHGGTVWAESPGEGMGATFTVQLPLLPITAKTDKKDESPILTNLSGLRILAVDDDNDIRELIAFILQQAGAEVRVVASATDALQQLEAFSPDLLISDIGMPDTDGYMLLRQIRSLSLGQDKMPPAIALTAYAGEVDRQQAIAAGFQMHLAKPIEPEKLLNAITRLLRGNNSGES